MTSKLLASTAFRCPIEHIAFLRDLRRVRSMARRASCLPQLIECGMVIRLVLLGSRLRTDLGNAKRAAPGLPRLLYRTCVLARFDSDRFFRGAARRPKAWTVVDRCPLRNQPRSRAAIGQPLILRRVLRPRTATVALIDFMPAGPRCHASDVVRCAPAQRAGRHQDGARVRFGALASISPGSESSVWLRRRCWRSAVRTLRCCARRSRTRWRGLNGRGGFRVCVVQTGLPC